MYLFFICWLVGWLVVFKGDISIYPHVKTPAEELMNFQVFSCNVNINELLNPYILSIPFS